MASVTTSEEVNVPVQTAYNQWTQFESFPHFMEGVEEVRQIDETHLHWRAKVSGTESEWDAVITEQVPDRVIAWQSTSGKPNNGKITFEPVGLDTTRLTVDMEWAPEGVTESVGSALGFDDRRVSGDLKRFKEFIESQGAETGAWRGEVTSGQTF